MSMSISSNYGNYGYYNNFIKENESGSVQAESKKTIQAPIAGALPTQSTERSVGPAPQAAVYEKRSDDNGNKAAYEIARKSPADRAAIVQQMKERSARPVKKITQKGKAKNKEKWSLNDF